MKRFAYVGATLAFSLVVALPPAYAAHHATKRALAHRKSVELANGAGLVATATPLPTASRHPDIEATELMMMTTDDNKPEPDPVAPTSSAPKPAQTSKPQSKAAAPDSTKDDEDAAASAGIVEDLKIGLAQRMVSLPICRREGSPEGRGEADVTFFPNGTVQVALTQPYARTEAGACIARRLAGAARPFAGAPVSVRVRFAL